MCIFANESFTQPFAIEKQKRCVDKANNSEEERRESDRTYCTIFEKTGRVQCPAKTGKLLLAPLRMKKRKGWSTAKLIEGGGA